MTIHLPRHRQERLAEILASIPPTQKRIGIKKWHKILGELRSMYIALPGSRFLFSQMQHALTTRNGVHVALKKGVHQAVEDFFLDASRYCQPPHSNCRMSPTLRFCRRFS